MMNATLRGKPYVENPRRESLLYKRAVSALVILTGFGLLAGTVPTGYVTEGLTACWDAIDNQATGTHDASATTWVDLVGGQAFALTGTSWGGNVCKYLQFAGTSTSYGTLTGADALALFNYTSDSTDRTVELVFKYDAANTDGVLLEGPTSSNIGIGRWYGGGRVIYGIGSDKTESTYPAAQFFTISAHYKSGYIQIGSTYQQNVAVELTKGNNYWSSANATTITLGKVTTANKYLFKGRLYAIRVYNRELMAEEATRNYNADIQRYNLEAAATVTAGAVTVDGTTYTAGETIKTDPTVSSLAVTSAQDAQMSVLGRITSFSVACAEDSSFTLAEGATSVSASSVTNVTVNLPESVTTLALNDGSLAIADKSSAELTYVANVTLGAEATLKLPSDGLSVTGTLTADAAAIVKGPGIFSAAAAEAPVVLSDGATYLSHSAAFTWPSSGVAYIPATTADITADDVAKVDALTKIVFLSPSSIVTYKLADDWTMETPLEGPGRFEFWSAGDITLSADNKNLTGCFFFTNTTVLVTHERGLGSTRAQTCHFWCGTTTTLMPYGHTLDFDDGNDVFTNRVAVWLHPLAGKNIVFGARTTDKTLVQDADFYFSRYNDNQDYLYPEFKSTVKFLRHFEYKVGAWTQYPYMNTEGGEGAWILGDFRLKNTGLWFLQNGPWHLGYTGIDSSVELSCYSTMHVVCEAANILGSMTFKPYQMNAIFDLNGYDQDCSRLCTYSGGSHVSGAPIMQFRSSKPASFRITDSGSYNVNPSFSGAAGFTKAGTGTYGLYNQSGEVVNDTTGELKVEAGTLLLADNYKWPGTNVTVTGGALQLAVPACVANDKTHLKVTGGTLSLQTGATMLVGYATFGTTNLLDGIYKKADLLALSEVAPYIAADWDDDATLTVQQPDDREWHGWPDEPTDVLVPGHTTIYVGSDETNKVAKALSIDVGSGGKVVFTNMPSAAIDWAVPVKGLGTVRFENCGTVTLASDNSGLHGGGFEFYDTDVVVSHRYGLGGADSGSCKVTASKTDVSYSMTFTGDAKTNDVAVEVAHACHYNFGYDSADVVFVQNGDLAETGGNTTSSRFTLLNKIAFGGVTTLGFVNLPKLMHLTETSKLAQSVDTMWLFGTSGTIEMDAANPSATLKSLIFQFGCTINCNVPYALNLIGGAGLSCYPGTTTFDLKGNDQAIARLTFANESKENNPVIFTSAEPATLYMNNTWSDAWRRFKVTGAVSLDYSGTKVQKMGNGLNETTGSLIVRSGTFEVSDGSYWGGTNVTVVGGTLQIDANCPTNALGIGTFFGRRTDLVVGSGTLKLVGAYTNAVRSLKVGDAYKPAGVYGGTAAGLDAEHTLDCVTGAGLLNVRRDAPTLGMMLLIR